MPRKVAKLHQHRKSDYPPYEKALKSPAAAENQDKELVVKLQICLRTSAEAPASRPAA
jgi:hypothetical protein